MFKIVKKEKVLVLKIFESQFSEEIEKHLTLSTMCTIINILTFNLIVFSLL